MIKSNEFIVKLDRYEKIATHRFILLYVPVVLLPFIGLYTCKLFSESNPVFAWCGLLLILVSLFDMIVIIALPDETIQWTYQYRQVAKFYKDKTIPEDIKLIINLCYCFNDKKNEDYLTSHRFRNYPRENLQYAVSVLSYVKRHPDVAEWMRKDINKRLKQAKIGSANNKDLHKYYRNSIPRTLSSLVPLAINVANTPDVFAHPEAYQTIIYGLYTAGNSMEYAIESYSAYLDKMEESSAKETLALWKKQDFNNIHSIGK